MTKLRKKTKKTQLQVEGHQRHLHTWKAEQPEFATAGFSERLNQLQADTQPHDFAQAAGKGLAVVTFEFCLMNVSKHFRGCWVETIQQFKPLSI